LGGIFDVSNRKLELSDKERLTYDPKFWDDPQRAELIMKEIKIHKHWISLYQNTQSALEDLKVMFEFFKEGEVSEEELQLNYQIAIDTLEEVEFKSTLNRPEDELGCLLEINAGAGGTEACDWAAMLSRMFKMWVEKQPGFKLSILNQQEGDVAGIKSVTYEITGDFAFGLLKGENGVHRLVRISPFNAQGKRMTSFASVFVHPLVDDRIEIAVNPADLEWDTFRSSGAGGQHVNKTESAVRVRHLPSGIVVECQEERSQHMNREKAIVMLKSKLYERELAKQEAEREKIESGKMKNEWGSQIRSYVLDDRRVKDHRTGHQTGNTDAVLDGEIDGFLKAFLLWNESGGEAVEE
jgi:peptide chain release factor 2